MTLFKLGAAYFTRSPDGRDPRQAPILRLLGWRWPDHPILDHSQSLGTKNKSLPNREALFFF